MVERWRCSPKYNSCCESDPISGAHCWLQKVTISKPELNEKYGDIFVDTNKSFEHFKKWNQFAKDNEKHMVYEGHFGWGDH